MSIIFIVNFFLCNKIFQNILNKQIKSQGREYMQREKEREREKKKKKNFIFFVSFFFQEKKII